MERSSLRPAPGVIGLLVAALACAGGTALLALLFYGSTRFSDFDARVTSHFLAVPESRELERVAAGSIRAIDDRDARKDDAAMKSCTISSGLRLACIVRPSSSLPG